MDRFIACADDGQASSACTIAAECRLATSRMNVRKSPCAASSARSEIVRTAANGTLKSWHTCAIAAPSISTARASGNAACKATLPAVRGIDKRVALFGEGPSGIVLVVDPEDADRVRALAAERDVPAWTLGAMGGDLLEIAPVLGLPIPALRDAYEGGLERALGRSL